MRVLALFLAYLGLMVGTHYESACPSKSLKLCAECEHTHIADVG
jgi:hypothetical protein